MGIFIRFKKLVPKSGLANKNDEFYLYFEKISFVAESLRTNFAFRNVRTEYVML